jgi:lactate dehydrogenase-like 2-hydroxyacid dehydrogenase
MGKAMIRILVEDDPYLRMIPVVLDPEATEDQRRAIADFMAHDVPDFDGWCRQMRATVPILYPAAIKLVATQEELRRDLPAADAAIVETLRIGEEEISRAPRLAIVQKFGTLIPNIDSEACARRGIPVETQPRRVNVAVAEHALCLMLALAKRLTETAGKVEAAALREAGFDPTPYDRRHTTNSNFARIGGLKTLNGSTLGALGLGEIGRNVARRARAFGMEVIYHQRNRMDPSDERDLGANYVPFGELLARADFLSIHLPLNAGTESILDRDALQTVKPGVIIVNIARARLIDRAALTEGLESGRIGGYGLDVGYDEPARQGEPLLKYRNVILTPHTAVAGRENGLLDMADIFVKVARAVAARRP